MLVAALQRPLIVKADLKYFLVELCSVCLFFTMHYLYVLAENGQVDGIRANYSALTVSLTDNCLKPHGQDCATQNVLQVLLHLYLRVSALRYL